MSGHKILILGLCIILSSITPGCGPGLFNRSADDAPVYEPPTDPMPVFDSTTLNRPHKIIGVITAKGGSFKRARSALFKLKIQAREMGGDALLDFRRGGVDVQGVPNVKGPTSSSPYYLYSAKVIVFTD
jgi:hypothetical protein